MAEADGLLIKFNPHWDRQRRDPKGVTTGGQWSDGEASGASPPRAPKDPSNGGIEQQVALQEDPTHAKKRRFVEAHLADAQKAADELHVPVENILGISAYESAWGESPFAKNGNNYFGIHYPSPRAIGFMIASASKAKVSKFENYAEGAKEFAERYSHIVGNVSDPKEFARILQDKAKFGVSQDGDKVAYYVKNVSDTMIGLRKYLNQYKI